MLYTISQNVKKGHEINRSPHTRRLAQLVENHYIMRVIEVLGKTGHILSCESVCTVDGLLLTVRPVHAILRDTQQSTQDFHMSFRKETARWLLEGGFRTLLGCC